MDAATGEAALRTLPAKAREGAKAVKLVKFSPAQIRQFHAGKQPALHRKERAC